MLNAGTTVSFIKVDKFVRALTKYGPILSAISETIGTTLFKNRSANSVNIGIKKLPACSTVSPNAIFNRPSFPSKVLAAVSAAPPKVADSAFTAPSKSLVFIKFSSRGIPSFCKSKRRYRRMLLKAQ